MSYSWNAILHNAARVISEAAGFPVREDELSLPPDSKHGELAFSCFKLAKALGKNPAQIAQELAAKIKNGDHSIETATAAGPYLNLSLRASDLVPRVIKDIETLKTKYGRGEEGAGKQLMLEYANPNTHKEIHIGHLRNFILGASLSRLLAAVSWDVVPVSYVNDMGANVSKCLWWLARRHEVDPRKLTLANVKVLLSKVTLEERNGRYLGHVYAEAGQQLETHPEWKDEVALVHAALENNGKAWTMLWRETRQWCLDEFRRIFDDLDVVIKRQYLESQFIERSQKIVKRLEEKGIAIVSQGALIVDLEAEKLGVAVIRKTDGALLYLTKDFALCEQKLKDYPEAERYLIVVDARQRLNFEQLFSILKKMGVGQKFEFVGYEIVTLKEGVMSSRKGNIVTWQDFRDQVLAYATKETQKRHQDWNEGKLTHTAWCLMMGGIKFGMLKQDSDKIYTFDLERALSFDGDTGPYVQYAVTRLGSILRKANWNPKSGLKQGDASKLVEGAEKHLAVTMALFPSVVARAGGELKPSLIAQWCLDMAGRTNEFYRDVPVLEVGEDLRAARLRLVASAQSVLLIALNLLAIPVPDEM